jgi:hypothetical protein
MSALTSSKELLNLTKNDADDDEFTELDGSLYLLHPQRSNGRGHNIREPHHLDALNWFKHSGSSVESRLLTKHQLALGLSWCVSGTIAKVTSTASNSYRSCCFKAPTLKAPSHVPCLLPTKEDIQKEAKEQTKRRTI